MVRHQMAGLLFDDSVPQLVLPIPSGVDGQKTMLIVAATNQSVTFLGQHGMGSPESESLEVGDWVCAPSGLRGRILMISSLSAFIEILLSDGNRSMSYLLSELTKIEPPTRPENNPPSAH